MTTNEDLIDWSYDWRLSDGVVTCRNFQARQNESDRATRFEHTTGCLHIDENRTPWHDLDAICNKLESKS
jgi:hypothetical protein